MLLVALLFTGRLQAVQVYGTSGTGGTYTTAPADNFGFENVGQVYDSMDVVNASGVYLGNGWMISAYHPVSDGSGGFLFGDVMLNGTNYAVNAPTAVRLSGTAGAVDLAMFRLARIPALGSVSVSSSSPAMGTALVLMGNGVNRAGSLSYWRTDTASTPWTWTAVQSSGTWNMSGYAYGSGQSLRWGNGSVAGSFQFNDGFGVNACFWTTFSPITGNAVEAFGDAGGGVFCKSGSTWKLSGIMLSTGTHSGQPANTSVVGDATYAADLAPYSSQINTLVTVQQPVMGTHPAGTSILKSGSAVFAVTASGTPSPVYRWQRLPAGSDTWGDITDLPGTYAGGTSGTLTLTHATLAMNGDQFRCVASNGYLPNATSNAATLTVQTAYQAWAAVCFGTQAGDASISGPTAMPINDGISNALKYLTDLNPTTPLTAANRAALPAYNLTTISGTAFATFTYRQRQILPDVTLAVLTRADLVYWTRAKTDAAQNIGTDAVTGDPMIQLRVPVSGNQAFYRLQIIGL